MLGFDWNLPQAEKSMVTCREIKVYHKYIPKVSKKFVLVHSLLRQSVQKFGANPVSEDTELCGTEA